MDQLAAEKLELSFHSNTEAETIFFHVTAEHLCLQASQTDSNTSVFCSQLQDSLQPLNDDLLTSSIFSFTLLKMQLSFLRKKLSRNIIHPLDVCF